jgi:hypothetical protein
MRPPKYPLEPLAGLREHQADEAVRGLASAVRAREEATRARVAAQARRDEHLQDAARVCAAEGEALTRGELTAADLARADAWAVRVAADRAALEAGIRQAHAAETASRDEERAAQAAAAARRADAEVVEKDRARWNAALRRSVEAREEEASFEAWRPKG